MALGFMRRHRRWLYVFLWLVIAAFIILYIPAFQGAERRQPGRDPGRASAGCRSRSASSRRAYLRQRQMYERCTRGAWTPRRSSAWGSRSRSSRAWWTERLSRSRRSASASPSPTRRVAREIATAPEFQPNGRFIGRGRDPAAPGAAGDERRGVRGGDPRATCCATSSKALVTDGVSVTPPRPSASSAAAPSRSRPSTSWWTPRASGRRWR